MSKTIPPTFSRILIIKPSSLGDVIHGLPVLHALRRRFVDARIDWLVSNPYTSLIEEHPDLNDVVPFDRARFGRLGGNIRATREFVQFVRTLRARQYDLVIDLQGLFRSGFLARASGAPTRIGLGDAREGARYFYTHRTRRLPNQTHAVDRNYAVGELLSFSDIPVTFHLPVAPDVQTEAMVILRKAGWSPGGKLLLVAPGTRWETKQWPIDRFARAIDSLQSDQSVRCVLVGSPAETQLSEEISHLCQTSPINLAGQTTLVQLVALIDLADTVLCHDSATMHIAAALEKPLVCLIGPTDPRRTGPYQRPNDVVRLDLDCSPCFFRRLSQCRHDHRCMCELEVPRVVAAVEKALDATSSEAV